MSVVSINQARLSSTVSKGHHRGIGRAAILKIQKHQKHEMKKNSLSVLLSRITLTRLFFNLDKNVSSEFFSAKSWDTFLCSYYLHFLYVACHAVGLACCIRQIRLVWHIMSFSWPCPTHQRPEEVDKLFILFWTKINKFFIEAQYKQYGKCGIKWKKV